MSVEYDTLRVKNRLNIGNTNEQVYTEMRTFPEFDIQKYLFITGPINTIDGEVKRGIFVDANETRFNGSLFIGRQHSHIQEQKIDGKNFLYLAGEINTIEGQTERDIYEEKSLDRPCFIGVSNNCIHHVLEVRFR